MNIKTIYASRGNVDVIGMIISVLSTTQCQTTSCATWLPKELSTCDIVGYQMIVVMWESEQLCLKQIMCSGLLKREQLWQPLFVLWLNTEG